jgi:hypothetical protein
MNRRNLLKALFALPAAAVAAPLAALSSKPFARGGIVPDNTPSLVGQHSCAFRIPASLVHHVEIRNYGDGPSREIARAVQLALERNIRQAVRSFENYQSRKRLR